MEAPHIEKAVTGLVKIGLVNDTIYPYSKGGAQKRVWEIARRLARRGHEVHLFGMKYWPGEDTIVREGVALHGVCPVQEIYTGGRRSITQALYFGAKLAGPLLRQKLDIVDCSNFPYFPCFSAGLHQGLKGSALVITWLEVWDAYWYQYLGRKGVFGKMVEKMVAHLPQEHLAISEVTRRQLRSLGVSGEISVVVGGIDWEEIQKPPPSGEKSDIIFAGRLIPDKHVDLLIQSLRRVKQTIPGVRCCIIGDGPEKACLEELVRAEGLEANVSCTGFLETSAEVFSRLKSSRVFVLPSTREGFGISLLEANACGLPVVTVRHPQNAAADLVQEGKNGFLAELTGEDLAQKIITALERGRDMEKDCRSYARQYSWDGVAGAVERAYLKALSRKRGKDNGTSG